MASTDPQQAPTTPARRPRRRRRRLLVRALALLVGVGVALLLGEGLVRVVGAGATTLSRGRLHSFDPDVGWIPQPNTDATFELPGSFRVHVRCNSRGLRDDETPFEKPAGTRRVVVLGDSFMWGYGVERDEMLPTLLERELPGVEAVNLGANGYSTVQELVRLETEGLRYHPDYVLLAFCHNDLESNFDDKDGGRPRVQYAEDGTLKLVNRPVRQPWKDGPTQWLRHHSRLFGALEFAADSWRMWLRTREHNAALTRGAASVTTNTVASDTAARIDVAVAAHNLDTNEVGFSILDLYARPSPAVDVAWKAEAELVGRIKALAEQAGARLVVVYVPMQEAVDPAIWALKLDYWGPEARALEPDWDRPSRRLGAVCAEQGIPMVDLVPVFRQQSDYPRLYLKKNGHWSAEGHRVATRAVAARLGELMAEAPPRR